MSALEALAAAHERTEDAGSARFELTYHWDMPAIPPSPRGRLVGLVLGVAKAGAKGLVRLAGPRFPFHGMSGEGYLDLTGRRYMVDFGSYAMLHADGEHWSGRSGRRLATLPADADHPTPTPLWLLDLLRGVVGASELEPDELGGAPVRHVTASVDLSRASAATPGGLAVPAETKRFEDLLALPVDVWFDSAHLRRVRFSTPHRTETLGLSDVGVSLDGLDWTRLPAFRSPDEVE